MNDSEYYEIRTRRDIALDKIKTKEAKLSIFLNALITVVLLGYLAALVMNTYLEADAPEPTACIRTT